MTNPRLEELRTKFQENPRRYFAPFANELRKAGDRAQAIAVCRTHLAGQPGHVSGHIVLGQALYEAGEPLEARDIFTAALELDPENLIALRSLGEIAQVNGEFNVARQWYQRLLDADPRNGEVAQLLKDIPAEGPKAELATPITEPLEEPTPLTLRQEAEAAETPSEPATPAPSFHTSFTGPGPAYRTAEDLAEHEEQQQKKREEEALLEPTLASAASDRSEEPFVDLEPSAHDQGDARQPLEEAVTPAAETAAEEIFDLSFEAREPEAPSTDESKSDESLEVVDVTASASAPEVTFESESPAEAIDTSLELGERDEGAAVSESASEVASSEPEAEPPRALFAERGFDGPADDEVGWMTTPSATFSDLEAAPEDWFDEAAQGEPEAAVGASDEAPVTAESTTPDQVTDSWFDEVPGAAAIEPTEVTTDELWLPPELPQVTSAEDNARRDDETDDVPDVAAEPPAWSASADEGEPVALPNVEETSWTPSNEVVAPAGSVQADEPSRNISPEPVASQHSPSDTESPESVSAEQLHAGIEEFHAEVQEFRAEVEEIRAESTAFDLESPASAEDAAVAGDPREETAWAATEALQPEEPSELARSSVTEAPPEFVYATEPGVASVSSESDAVIGHTPGDVVSAPQPAPFVTETLADLYLQQGFRDEALSIYRQLLDRNPDDEELKARIASIERRDVPAPASAPVPGETRAASQSVRTFFSRLARRPAVTSGAPGNPVGASEASDQQDAPFNVAASALANLFAASNPPTSDEGAASTLAGAFTDPVGRPSRAAERELSLDHLFRDVPPGGTASGGVTLDEFYSTPKTAPGSSTESGAEAAPEESGGTDIRQFTAWLEGLRKK